MAGGWYLEPLFGNQQHHGPSKPTQHIALCQTNTTTLTILLSTHRPPSHSMSSVFFMAFSTKTTTQHSVHLLVPTMKEPDNSLNPCRSFLTPVALLSASLPASCAAEYSQMQAVNVHTKHSRAQGESFKGHPLEVKQKS